MGASGQPSHLEVIEENMLLAAGTDPVPSLLHMGRTGAPVDRVSLHPALLFGTPSERAMLGWAGLNYVGPAHCSATTGPEGPRHAVRPNHVLSDQGVAAVAPLADGELAVRRSARGSRLCVCARAVGGSFST